MFDKLKLNKRFDLSEYKLRFFLAVLKEKFLYLLRTMPKNVEKAKNVEYFIAYQEAVVKA